MTHELEEIELTDDEIKEAILEAKREKQRRINNAAYLAKINNIPQPIFMDAAQYHEFLNSRNTTGITYKGESLNILYGLIAHFTRNNKAKELLEKTDNIINEYSHEKGIFLIGGVGVGKTTLMRIFQQNPTAPFYYKSCKEIAYDYMNNGVDVISNYGTIKETKTGFGTLANCFNISVWGYYFDDLGAEQVGKHYGNELDPVSEIIELRYSNQIPYNYTNVSTNLNMAEIKQRYGTRIYDRIFEMFNIIELRGESKRA